MQTTSLMSWFFNTLLPARSIVLPPVVHVGRPTPSASGLRRRRTWTPARRHAETAACARRRRQIAAGRLTVANGLVTTTIGG